MKRGLIFIALIFAVAPIGAFALLMLKAFVCAMFDLDFNADESWLKSVGYSYGIVAGYLIWGVEA